MASKTNALTTISIPQLRSDFKDRVVAPGDSDYDKARTVFYGGVDRHPAVIIKVANADDVSRVVNLARESGLELAVRSGGHSVAGHSVSEGGIVLDLSNMKDLQIDPESRTAWAETGLTAAELTTALGAYGLAVGFGDTGSVGIGGAVITFAIPESSSGADSDSAIKPAMVSGVAGRINMPPTTAGTSCRRNLKRVATPKLPPPPRSAQKRSA